MIFDTFLSDPPGYACTTCHILDAGNTGPSSRVNEFAGTMPGVRPNRWSNRKPQTYGYAAFSPYGPYFDNNLGVWIGGNFWDGRVVDLVGQAQQPPINPVEMANTPTNGLYPPPFGGYSATPRREAPAQALHQHAQEGVGPERVRAGISATDLHPLCPGGLGGPGLGRGLSIQLEVGRLRSMARRRSSSIRSRHPKSAGRILYGLDRIPPTTRSSAALNASRATTPRDSPMDRASSQRANTHAGEEHVHHVLLRQHRCPEERQQPLLLGDRLPVQPPRV